MASNSMDIAHFPRTGKPSGTVSDYVAIARPDHWTKHVFIVPGIILAYVLRGTDVTLIPSNVLVGFASAAAIASANYVINEWLDRAFDSFHPSKAGRTAVIKALSPRLIYLEYFLLIGIGLGLAWVVSGLFFVASVAFVVSGLIYNVKPLRSKDRVYVDVLTEALNNPIRLGLGWAMVDPYTLPPSSLIVAYWMGGAFLMGTKRLSEYRDIASSAGTGVLKQYRRSFRFYTEESLLVSSFLYALLSSFCIAVFLVKYRAEYILALPFVAALFAVYLALALKRDSVAQRPEKLFREHILMSTAALAVIAFGVFSFVDLPFLNWISQPHLIDF